MVFQVDTFSAVTEMRFLYTGDDVMYASVYVAVIITLEGTTTCKSLHFTAAY